MNETQLAERAEVEQFVNQLGLLWERYGLSRSVGRMIGWLMVCDPPHQTANQIAEALQISKASVSTGTRTLEAMGLVERVTFPGRRQTYYRSPPDAWSALNRIRMREVEYLLQMGEKGRKALEGAPGDRLDRINNFMSWAKRWQRAMQELLAEAEGEGR